MKNVFKDVKVDPTRVLGIAVTAIGLAGTLLSNKLEDHKMKNLKDEVTKDVLKQINKES